MAVKKKALKLLTKGLVFGGRYVSPRLAIRAGCAISRRVALDSRFDRRQLVENLALYFPERDPAWRRSTAGTIQGLAARARIFDKAILPRLPLDELDRMCVQVNMGPLERARAEGRGVVVVSLHYGRYWVGPVWFSRHGWTASAFQQNEGKLPARGATLSGSTFSAKTPLAATRHAIRALRDGHIVFHLLDAGSVGNPLVVDFLGQPTHISAAPLRLARSSDALLVPSLGPSDPDDPERIRMEFYDAVDPREVPRDEPPEVTMRRLLEPFETQIRRDPSQWYSANSAHLRIAPRPDAEQPA